MNALARHPLCAAPPAALALALATCLLALLLALPARAAEPGRDPARDPAREPSGARETAGAIFDALTNAPGARGTSARQPGSSFGSSAGASSGGQAGPRAPAQPTAPQVREVRALPSGVSQARPGPAPRPAPRGSARDGSAGNGSPLSDAPLPGQTPWPGARSDAQSYARPPARPDARSGDVVLTLEHDGRLRRALARAPAQKAPGKGQVRARLPVVIFLHGAGGSAAQAMRQTRLAEAAARQGFLAVFPEGLAGPAGAPGQDSPGGQTWNAWSCCGYARDARMDDVGYLAALIARLVAEHRADPRRIHLAGFSNGAMLASRFALERPGLAASIASVAGHLPCDAPAPREPLPVLLIHGDRDQVARFGPGEAHQRTGRLCEDHPARAQAEFWARGMGLAARPRQVRDGRLGRALLERYGPGDGRAGRALVEFVVVRGGGHAWPGGARERFRYCDLPPDGPDATALVLDFFRRTPRPAAPDQVRTDQAEKPGRAQKQRRPGR